MPVCQEIGIPLYEIPAPRHEFGELSHLGKAKSALEIGDSIIKPQLVLLVIPRPIIAGQPRRIFRKAMATQVEEPLVDTRVIGQDGPALSGRDMFDRMERECRHIGMRT